MVMPMGSGGNDDSLFQKMPYNPTEYIESCQAKFNVTRRPHWITTEFGGHVSFQYSSFSIYVMKLTLHAYNLII